MKTLRKIRKNVKALSPVVASIILIAVTVAVSIAVAAWMGALTVGFMGSSSVTINSVAFTTGTPNSITLTMKNTGTKSVTIESIRINNNAVTDTITWTGTNSTIVAGETGKTAAFNYAWVAGNPYKIDLYDSSGQVVGSYQATAPA
jgi:flagellin-like protein